MTTREEILNKACAIDKLRSKSSENIVQVIKHGWFPDYTPYYIDVELYDANLERYIQDALPMSHDQPPNPCWILTLALARYKNQDLASCTLF